MKTLLNGEERILLGYGDTVDAGYHPGGMGDPSYLIISRPSRGWSVQLRNIRPSHLSTYTSGVCGDFLFRYWREQDLLCIAGYKSFFALDGESGHIAASEPLEFTNKESLDFLEMPISSEKDKLLIVSTKLAWLIGPAREDIKKIEIPGLVQSVAAQDDGFIIRYLDTANIDLPEVSMFVR